MPAPGPGDPGRHDEISRNCLYHGTAFGVPQTQASPREAGLTGAGEGFQADLRRRPAKPPATMAEPKSQAAAGTGMGAGA